MKLKTSASLWSCCCQLVPGLPIVAKQYSRRKSCEVQPHGITPSGNLKFHLAICLHKPLCIIQYYTLSKSLWDHILHITSNSNCVAPWHELGNQRPNKVIRARAPMLTTGTAACTSSFSLELQRKRATSLLSTVKTQMNDPLRSGSKNSTMPSRRFK